MKMKLNILLAITDALRIKFKNMVADYTKFYSKSQGAFQGVKDTYAKKEDTVDDDSKKKHIIVATTVDEKINYFIQESKEFINALFSQEKTNSTGAAKAMLTVDGVSWGEFTSLELLRLKSLLEAGDLGNLETMISNIPVRSDSIIWNPCKKDEYKNRNIWETNIIKSDVHTTDKEDYILPDPNVEKGLVKAYTPKVSARSTKIVIGEHTHQNFSGEWSHRERANALKRRNTLLIAVIKALKESNECEVQESILSTDLIFGYILKGIEFTNLAEAEKKTKK